MIRSLRTKRYPDADIAILEQTFFGEFQDASLDGDFVDTREEEILRVCNGLLSRGEIRRFSYGNLLYTELRSSYSHEFGSGRLIGFPFSERNCPAVSYWNYGKEPSETNQNEIDEIETHWRVHFKVE